MVEPDGVAVTTVREDKLADTAPKQPLLLTLGAAAATLVVVLGVLAGPNIVTCFSAEEGMGVCLRGKMIDAGLLPSSQPAPIEAEAPAAPAPAVMDTTAPAADVAVAAVDPTPPPTPAGEDSASSDGLIAATFGLLRAEPDGSVVIAGSGAPGSEVQVYANGAVLGKTKVGPSGDWVIVPDAPIAPGGAEITLGETGKQGVAAESFVVAINEDKTSEPLVVASTPGAISEVLQGLKPTAETKLAAADPAIPAALAQPATAPTPAVAPAALAQPAPAADPAVPTAPAVPAATEATVPPPATPPEPQPEPSVAVAAPAAVAPAETSPAPAAPPAAPVAAPAAPSLAAVAPAPAATPAAPAKPVMTMAPPTIDAVEVEGDRAFFAGAGPDGATVRLYVDDVFIADATVADGRWLVEAGKVLTKPTQRVRVDLLEAGSANVASRAEVDFRIDLPAAPAETTVAAAEPAAPAAPDAAAAPATTAPAAPAAETAQAAQPLPAEPAPMAAAPAEAVPTLVAVSVGKLDDQRFSAGKAIIRRGDNLWTIARRVYGEGIKFTTIYEANTGQIRDPDRIYPGQVFNLPDGTTN